MAQRSKGKLPAEDGNRRSARLLARWIVDNWHLLHGLRALRDFGPEAEEAVDAVLAMGELARMRLSWRLWETLALGSGIDADTLLVQYVSDQLVGLAREALWGDDEQLGGTGGLSVVPPPSP